MCSNKCIPFSQEDLCMLYFNIITFIWFSLQLKLLLSTHFHIWLPLAQPPSSTKGHLWSGNRTQHGEQHGGPTPRTWAASWWHQSMDTQFHPINRKSEMDDRLTNTLLYHYNTINLHFITWKFSIFLVSIFFLFSFVWNSRHKFGFMGKIDIHQHMYQQVPESIFPHALGYHTRECWDRLGCSPSCHSWCCSQPLCRSTPSTSAEPTGTQVPPPKASP